MRGQGQRREGVRSRRCWSTLECGALPRYSPATVQLRVCLELSKASDLKNNACLILVIVNETKMTPEFWPW